MEKTEYTALNLPKKLVEELKIWRMAYSASYGKTVSYAEMIRGMLDSMEDTEPGVVDDLKTILERHPDLSEKMAAFKGEGDERKNFN